MNVEATISVTVITILISIGAIIISLASLISNHFWKKYENHLIKKEIIRKSLDDFNRKVIDDYLMIGTKNNIKNINDLYFVMTTNFRKNKSSLILLLALIKEKIIEDKKFNESIFWCSTCSNFYKTEGIKLIYSVISLPDYGQIAINGFLDSINNNLTMPVPIEKLFETEEWEFWYILLFNFSIDLFYLRKSLNEFINTNFYDINNFDFENWLNDIPNTGIIENSIKYKEYIKYIDNFLKALANPKSNKELKIFFKIVRRENPLNEDRFIIEQNFLVMKKIFEWYKTQLPLANEEILKKKNKIAFSISKCHFCIFLNLGIYNTLNKDKLDEILKKANIYKDN